MSKLNGATRSRLLRAKQQQAWREVRDERRDAEEGVATELWSGRTAILRMPRLEALMATGKIPDLLTPLVYRMVFYGQDAKTLADLEKFDGPGAYEHKTPEEIDAQLKLYDAVCRDMFIAPRIVDDPQADDEIAIDDVHPLDRALCWQLATGGLAFLKSFRVAAYRSLEPVHDGDGEPLPPVEPAADSAADAAVGGVSVRRGGADLRPAAGERTPGDDESGRPAAAQVHDEATIDAGLSPAAAGGHET